MRSKFPGYYSLSDDEFDEMWDKAIIVLDTNVLLDFYRVSSETQSDLLSLLKFYGSHDRLWIPYQVALEYHDNLYGVVFEQMHNYDETLKTLKNFLGSITQKRNHPFLNDDLINRANNFMKDIDGYFDSQKKKLRGSTNDTSLKGKIADVFDGHVGESFSEDQLKQIYDEGRNRYLKNIPPGYEDKKKGEPDMYKDLIVWREVLKYALDNHVSVIFVSSDTKKDWYLVEKGQTICPHPLLVKEFQNETNQNILLYSLERFMSLAKDRKVVKIQEDSIEELKEKDTEMHYSFFIRSGVKKEDLDKEMEVYNKLYHHLHKCCDVSKRQASDASDMGSTSSSTVNNDFGIISKVDDAVSDSGTTSDEKS